MGGQEGGTGLRKGEPGKAVQAGKRGKELTLSMARGYLLRYE